MVERPAEVHWRGAPGSVGRAFIVVVLAWLVAGLFTEIGTTGLDAAGVAAGTTAGRIALIAVQFVGFGAGVGLYAAAGDRWDLIRLRRPTTRDLAWIAGGVVVLLVAALGVERLLTAFGVEVASNQVVSLGRDDPAFFLYMIPISLLFVGPFEELVFRGTAQEILARAWGPVGGIVIASTMFGLIHWPALAGTGGRLPYVAVAAALGLVLGTIYEQTGNLVVPAVAHGAYNAVLFGFQYLVVTGAVG